MPDTFARLPREENEPVQPEEEGEIYAPREDKPRIPPQSENSGQPLVGKNDPANVIKTVNNDRIKVKTRRIPPECNN